jgi:hypothetical protein
LQARATASGDRALTADRPDVEDDLVHDHLAALVRENLVDPAAGTLIPR